MPLYDSADLLRRARALVRQPADDVLWGDADWYDALTDAQAQRVAALAALAPDAMLGTPVRLTSADGGQTYALDPAATGGVALYRTYTDAVRPEGAATYALIPGVDFHVEGGPAGARVRFPAAPPAFPDGGPWAVFARLAGVLDAANPPTLQPPHARLVCVYDACARYATVTGRRDPGPYAVLAQGLWQGREAGDVGILGTVRLQFAGSAAVAGLAPHRAGLRLNTGNTPSGALVSTPAPGAP